MGLYFRSENRIRKGKEYSEVFQKGERIANQNLVIIFLNRADELPARMGIVVTNKIGNACQRNRLKRLARESFRSYLPHIKSGYDIVILFRKRARDINSRSFNQGFQEMLRAAGLLSD